MKKRPLLTALLILLFASLLSGIFAVCYTAADIIRNEAVRPGYSLNENKRVTANIEFISPGILIR